MSASFVSPGFASEETRVRSVDDSRRRCRSTAKTQTERSECSHSSAAGWLPGRIGRRGSSAGDTLSLRDRRRLLRGVPGPLVGSEYDRSGKRKATKEVSGVSTQLLRYIDVLMISPWGIELGEENGYPFSQKRTIQIANPASFLAQKILIHDQRDHQDRAKDLLYMHDTIELFSEHLGELKEIYSTDVRPSLHAKRIAELSEAADELFGKINDTIREAARMAAGRQLNVEAFAETSRAGLKEIFVVR
jgi:hypothetical protein